MKPTHANVDLIGTMDREQLGKFWSHVDKTGDCWTWNGRRMSSGYGLWTVRPRLSKATNVGAHRVAYLLLVGPIPDGLVLDHLCRNRSCVNPSHLEPVTIKENVRRGRSEYAERTHCPKGHPYDAANTYLYPNPQWRQHRACRQCVREYQRAYYARKRARTD